MNSEISNQPNANGNIFTFEVAIEFPYSDPLEIYQSNLHTRDESADILNRQFLHIACFVVKKKFNQIESNWMEDGF